MYARPRPVCPRVRARGGLLPASTASARPRPIFPLTSVDAGPAAALRRTAGSSLRCRPDMVSTWLTSCRRNPVTRGHELIDRCRSVTRGCPGTERMGCFQELAEQRAGQRGRECVALRKKNSPLAQIFHLVKVLDPLGVNLHAHAVCKLDQSFDDRRRVAL